MVHIVDKSSEDDAGWYIMTCSLAVVAEGSGFFLVIWPRETVFRYCLWHSEITWSLPL